MTSAISLHSAVTVTTEQVSCDLAGEAVVLNLASGLYFGLNAVGARIWELLQDHRTLLEIRDELVRTHPEVGAERCTEDLLNILAELEEAQLVRVSREPT